MERTRGKTPQRKGDRGQDRKQTHVGDIVRRFRKTRHLYVRTLADKCGFSPHAAVIRTDARPVVESEWSRARIEAIEPISEDSQLESMVITLKAGGASGSRPSVRRAEQLAVVLQGTVELTLDENVDSLKRGDAACIPSGLHHCWRNPRRKPAQILLVTAHLQA